MIERPSSLSKESKAGGLVINTMIGLAKINFQSIQGPKAGDNSVHDRLNFDIGRETDIEDS